MARVGDFTVFFVGGASDGTPEDLERPGGGALDVVGHRLDYLGERPSIGGESFSKLDQLSARGPASPSCR